MVDAEADAVEAQAESYHGTKGSKEKRHPVAAEKLAKAAAGETGHDGRGHGGVVAFLVFNLFQFFFVLV